MAGKPEPDDLCPSCGVPVPFARRGPNCPHCGAELTLAAAASQTTGLLTPFGYGVCGLIAGGMLGAAAALTNEDLRLGDPRLMVFPAAAAFACALVASQVGRRLHTGVRRGYEAFLLALVLAALAVLFLALAGVSSVEALGATGACAGLAALPLVRHAVHGRR
jgi:hypothetical protein